MGWFTAIVLYALIWWVVLFAVLPIGTRPSTDIDPHHGWAGAPQNPHLLRKAIITTVVAAVIWGAAIWLITSDYLSFRHGILAATPWD